MAAVATYCGDLDRALIDVHVVDLICLGRRVGAGDCDIDGSVDRNADIDQATRKMAAATIACAVGPGRDRVGAAPQAVGDKASAAAHRTVSVAAIPSDAGHLNGGLIQIHAICLDRVSTGIIARYRDVDRVIQHDSRMDEPSIEVTV